MGCFADAAPDRNHLTQARNVARPRAAYSYGMNHFWLVGVFVAFAAAGPVRAGLRIDLSPDIDRKDILSRGCENWKVPDGPSASATFGGTTVAVRAAGQGAALSGVYWKGGYDTNARLASDGVTCTGAIEVTIKGLRAGRHSVATFHNAEGGQPAGLCDILVGGRVMVAGVQPTHRVANDADAASAFVQADVSDGKDLTLTIRPRGDGGVVLNGIEIDLPDPTRRACKPFPADGDEHAPENPVLAWTAGKSASVHHLYLGTNRADVEAATPASPSFKGKVNEAKHPTSGLNTFDTYFWRVDEVDSFGQVARGPVWSFRVRHLAFPGAEGYGRFARGGRGGRVIEVTNLDDSGPGSLRDAVEAEGPRTVIFRVGGTIQLKSKLLIRNPYITIAGQTAPGDGIAVRGFTFGNLGTHDTIIRYVRIRVGDESGQTMDGTGFASSDHCIMDHCSISWSIDEAVSSRGAGNITLQRCIVAEALNVAGHAKYGAGKGHSFAASISGNIGSFHHNLLAHCAGRNWSLAGGLTGGGKFAGYVDIRNNVVYNWQHRTNDGGVRKLNLVNNYYIPGPATKVFHLLVARIELRVPGDIQQFYVAGNMMEGRPQYDADNWKNGGVIGPDMAEMKLDKPFCEPYVTTQTAREAYENVIADVGANWPRHDAVDLRVLADVKKRGFTFKGSKTGTPGIIDSQKDVGGWPQLQSGPVPADTDRDGMPDEWEKQHGLDMANPADGNADSAGDGYTNLERYLNGIVTWRN